jgi:hypothetical protein
MVNLDWTFDDDFVDELIDILLAARDGDLPVEESGFDKEDIAAAASLGLISTRVARDVFCGEWQITPAGRLWLEEAGEDGEDLDEEEN